MTNWMDAESQKNVVCLDVFECCTYLKVCDDKLGMQKMKSILVGCLCTKKIGISIQITRILGILF